jgi:hypothetical protein
MARRPNQESPGRAQFKQRREVRDEQNGRGSQIEPRDEEVIDGIDAREEHTEIDEDKPRKKDQRENPRRDD